MDSWRYDSEKGWIRPKSETPNIEKKSNAGGSKKRQKEAGKKR